MVRTRQFIIKTGSQPHYDIDFNGTQTDIQSLTGCVTYLEQFAPKPNSAAVAVTPPTNPNTLYAARQHTHQAKDIVGGILLDFIHFM